jgi:hypothetical protein
MGFTPSGLNTGAAGNATTHQTDYATVHNYVGSGELASIAIHEPEVDRYLTRRYGRDDLSGLLSMLGMSKEIERSEYTHFEKDFIHSKVLFNAYTTSAGADVATLTIKTADQSALSYGYPSPYVSENTVKATVPQKYDILQCELASGTLELQVVESFKEAGSALSDFQIKVATLDGGDVPSIANTVEFFIKGNAVNEGSTKRMSRNARTIRYQNVVTKHRDDYKVTDVEWSEKTWFEINGEKRWHIEGMADAARRFHNECEMMLFDGKMITAGATGELAALSGMETVTKSEGLITTIEDSGHNVGYTTDLDIEDLVDMTRSLDRYKGQKRNLLLAGFDFRRSFNKLFREGDGADLGATGSLARVEFGDRSADQIAMNLDFGKVKFNEYEFLVKQTNAFSDPNTLGVANSKYSGMGVVIPLGSTVVYNDLNEAGSKETVPTIRVNYKKGLEYREQVEGGFGILGASNSSEAAGSISMLSHKGLEVFAINQFGLFKKAG